MKNKSKLAILLTAGTITALTLAKPKETETFTGKLESSNQICNHVAYGFDTGEEKLKYVEGIPQGLEKGKTYEVTKKDRYLLPDKISYKELKNE